MFFRRETPHQPTFAEHIESLKNLGFAVTTLDSRRVRVTRDGIGAVLED